MQEHDARILRGAAIPTLIIGVGATALFALLSGTAGAAGAFSALLLLLLFFGSSAVAVSRISKRNPELFMPAMMGAFLVKAVLLAVALVLLRGVDSLAWMDMTAFAVTALLGVVAWLGGHTYVLATSTTLHVEPESVSTSPGGEPKHENA
ncbi:hypothetical protein [Nocardiopsis ansamitocini]|uniref:ATP synthase protein I n=1 Tax=Nocardiopsis ansamitocini TaxID=1670832 RepID=A0A9W6PBA5_9ACTN|nr:hypothetical protein [Nocardiopsis ansamitocini]GLU50397.1 hypothetical protein Nans01_47480 [Nocardiopsis ansamitocini]